MTNERIRQKIKHVEYKGDTQVRSEIGNGGSSTISIATPAA
jgi:hypothetical protein